MSASLQVEGTGYCFPVQTLTCLVHFWDPTKCPQQPSFVQAKVAGHFVLWCSNRCWGFQSAGMKWLVHTQHLVPLHQSHKLNPFSTIVRNFCIWFLSIHAAHTAHTWILMSLMANDSQSLASTGPHAPPARQLLWANPNPVVSPSPGQRTDWVELGAASGHWIFHTVSSSAGHNTSFVLSIVGATFGGGDKIILRMLLQWTIIMWIKNEQCLHLCYTLADMSTYVKCLQKCTFFLFHMYIQCPYQNILNSVNLSVSIKYKYDLSLAHPIDLRHPLCSVLYTPAQSSCKQTQ